MTSNSILRNFNHTFTHFQAFQIANLIREYMEVIQSQLNDESQKDPNTGTAGVAPQVPPHNQPLPPPHQNLTPQQQQQLLLQQQQQQQQALLQQQQQDHRKGGSSGQSTRPSSMAMLRQSGGVALVAPQPS